MVREALVYVSLSMHWDEALRATAFGDDDERIRLNLRFSGMVDGLARDLH